MEKLQQAVEGRDFKEIKMAAHSLKSSNVGAKYLIELCSEMEMLDNQKDHEQSEIILSQIKNEYSLLKDALKEELTK
ncbi:MAG TPA: Hpt domain-containing protein [Thermodesulfovibrionia bacterium]|nr:Hpt domain-containing protein [Thermodesulfovibrionia bacterium]